MRLNLHAAQTAGPRACKNHPSSRRAEDTATTSVKAGTSFFSLCSETIRKNKHEKVKTHCQLCGSTYMLLKLLDQELVTTWARAWCHELFTNKQKSNCDTTWNIRQNKVTHMRSTGDCCTEGGNDVEYLAKEGLSCIPIVNDHVMYSLIIMNNVLPFFLLLLPPLCDWFAWVPRKECHPHLWSGIPWDEEIMMKVIHDKVIISIRSVIDEINLKGRRTWFIWYSTSEYFK